MCGLAGFTRFHRPTGDADTLKTMGDVIQHRGPDAAGVYLDEELGLVFRRLAIIDLSEAGNQPMHSDSGDLVIVFNGEIYNFLELRNELEEEGATFRTRTDTEVILKLYERMGSSCLSKLNGMFAIAIWDKKKHELFLARDRLGKKPLYYFSDGNRFVFGSEIKSIFQVDDIPREVRPDAVFDFFVYQYVPDPKSIYKQIHKLPPAHWMTVSRDSISMKSYWDVSFETDESLSESEASECLLELLNDSTKRRMVSDVPLGAFLSGGVDSSGIVALMAANSGSPVTTCSIGFDDESFDEVEYARTVANQYATQHYELTVRENVVGQVARIAEYFDEPFADPSLVPTYFVSKLAREKVTVALAGDGGDENFAGYEKYRIDSIENAFRRRVPRPVSSALSRVLGAQSNRTGSRLLRKCGTLLRAISQSPAMGFYYSNAFMSDATWNKLVRPDFASQVSGYHPSSVTCEHYQAADADDHLSRILYTDIKTYLAGGILVKVDRMSMANSLEVRAPILDYKVVEYAAKLSPTLKLSGSEKKHLLKKSFQNLLPEEILYRKKMGFSVPLAGWLRKELRESAESLLLSSVSGVGEVFCRRQIQAMWDEHQGASRDHSTELWSMLMFELWWQAYISNSRR